MATITTRADREQSTALTWGVYLMTLGAIAFIGYGVIFFVLNFTDSFLELGIGSDQVASGKDEIEAFDNDLYHYISHLHIGSLGFIAATGLAVAALSWFGVRRRYMWAWVAAVVAPVLALAVALPAHYPWGFATIGHLGLVYLATAIFVVGALLALQELIRGAKRATYNGSDDSVSPAKFAVVALRAHAGLRCELGVPRRGRAGDRLLVEDAALRQVDDHGLSAQLKRRPRRWIADPRCALAHAANDRRRLRSGWQGHRDLRGRRPRIAELELLRHAGEGGIGIPQQAGRLLRLQDSVVRGNELRVGLLAGSLRCLSRHVGTAAVRREENASARTDEREGGRREDERPSSQHASIVAPTAKRRVRTAVSAKARTVLKGRQAATAPLNPLPTTSPRTGSSEGGRRQVR